VRPEPASQWTDAGSGTRPTPAVDDGLPNAVQLRAWQEEIDGIEGGYRPTGSPAHERFIALLVDHLKELGVSDVHTDPYAFQKWTPTNWSLELLFGSSKGPVPLAGYVPYSGLTIPGGVTAPFVYLSTTGLADAIGKDGLLDMEAVVAKIAPALAGSIVAAGGVTGKMVLFDVPALTLPLSTLTGGAPKYTNDPAGRFTASPTMSRVELSTMLLVPGILRTLATYGSIGAVGVIDAPEPIARGHYAPFFGTASVSVPSLYVTRETGATLKAAIAEGGLLSFAKLRLEATVELTTSENIVGVIPGATDQELLVSSHTDGPNSLEDNGPVGILALANHYLKLPRSERPRTLRIVLTGGHFVGSTGILTWVAANETTLLSKTLAVLEVEHLGAREWTETASGTMALTGSPEPQLL
jgi:hypothetical protein